MPHHSSSSHIFPLFPLKKGSMIDVITPGCGVNKEEWDLTQAFLKKINIKTQFKLFKEANEPYLAASDAHRFAQLTQALANEASDIIWCLRGGYGCARLLPMLQHFPRPKKEKLVIGFSDITALQIFLYQHWGWRSLHAPVLLHLAKKSIDKQSMDTLQSLLFGKESQFCYTPLHPLNAPAKRKNTLKSPVVGGNLTIVQTSIGTPWQINTKGTILLLEEYNEQAYRIDRSLHHLQQAGLFDNVKAVIFGNMGMPKEEGGLNTILYTIKNFANTLPVPVLYFPDIGHGKTNLPIPIGVPVTLTSGRGAGATTYFLTT